jgi:hypothetical protein
MVVYLEMGSIVLKRFFCCAFLMLGAARLSQADVLTPRIGLGHPAPSWIGVSLSSWVDTHIEAGLAFGYLNKDLLTTYAFSADARLHPFLLGIIDPFLAGGLTWVRFGGSGEFQGIDASTLLPFLGLGLDVKIYSVRVSGGYVFHFPIKLNFPFVEVGYDFQ